MSEISWILIFFKATIHKLEGKMNFLLF